MATSRQRHSEATALAGLDSSTKLTNVLRVPAAGGPCVVTGGGPVPPQHRVLVFWGGRRLHHRLWTGVCVRVCVHSFFLHRPAVLHLFVLLQVFRHRQPTLTWQKVQVMHPSSIRGVEDMSTLEDLHDGAILHNLFLRYQQRHVYVSLSAGVLHTSAFLPQVFHISAVVSSCVHGDPCGASVVCWAPEAGGVQGQLAAVSFGSKPTRNLRIPFFSG